MKIVITAFKFEIVNGKKTGRSFSFSMDPKEMAKYKTEATLRKKIEEYVANSGVFKMDEHYGFSLMLNKCSVIECCLSSQKKCSRTI